MEQYKDVVVLKTNKPNSRKVIETFMREFGYKDYEQESQVNKTRTAAVCFIPEDIEDEVLNFSREEEYKNDKFTVQYFKVDNKQEEHLVRTIEILNGVISNENIDNVQSFVAQKHNDSAKIVQPTVEEQQIAAEPKSAARTRYNQHNNGYIQDQNISPVTKKTESTSRERFSKKHTESQSKSQPIVKQHKFSPKKNKHPQPQKPKQATIVDPIEQQRINNLKANRNNPNHPDYDPSAAKKKKPKL